MTGIGPVKRMSRGNQGVAAGLRTRPPIPLKWLGLGPGDARLFGFLSRNRLNRLLGLEVLIALGRRDLQAVDRGARSGRNQASHDHVFLQALEIIDLSGHCRFGQHPRGFLERGRGDEGIGLQRGLGDALKHGFAGRRLQSLDRRLGVGVVELGAIHLFADQERRFACILDFHFLQHLTDDDFDVLVVDLNALQTIDVLDLVDEIFGQRLDAKHAQNVVWHRVAIHQQVADFDEIAFLN